MGNIDLIRRNNLEAYGKYFLEKGLNFFLVGSYNIAYEYLKEGLDLITCDCSGWNSKLDESTKDIFKQLDVPKKQQRAYLFCKGYLLSFMRFDKKHELYDGMNAIEQYLEIEQDEYGYYVKGKILHRLDQKKDSLKSFYKAYNIKSTARTEYRIGRLVEEESIDYGLDLLYSSFTKNPSSSCCVRILKEFTNKGNIEIPIDSSENNELLTSFNDTNIKFWTFGIEYSRLLNKEFSDENLDKVNSFVSLLIKGWNIIDDTSDYESSYDNYGYNDYSNPMDSEFYNDALDLDQQSPEFWDDI
jgi:tetratricopeptide (TPR) repeat protein